MVIMNSVLAAFFIFFCLAKGGESCFSRDHYEYTKLPTGSTFYKECRCTESNPGKLRWLDINNNDIPLLRPGTKSNVHAEWQDKNTFSLFISNISKSVSGIYKCVTEHNGREYALTYKVDAFDRPYFVRTNKEQFLVSGKDSTISCEARGGGGSDLIITWYKDNNLIVPDANKYEVTPNGLTIKNVSNEDNGSYKCAASDPETSDSNEKIIKVEVMHLPVIDELVPIGIVTNVSGDTIVTAGNGLVIECKANGIPHPTYSWRKISESGVEEHNVTWDLKTNEIIFDRINPEDQGIYECTANNIAGNATKQIKVTVLVPPVITEFDDITAVEGSQIQVVCKANGRPQPNVTIDFEKDIPDDSVNIIPWNLKYPNKTQTELYLTFDSVSRAHSGAYVCIANNEVDTVSREMTLTVRYKPFFKEDSEHMWGWFDQSVNLNCSHDSNPPASVSWKYQGTDIPTDKQVKINNLMVEYDIMPLKIIDESMYGIYECTATNNYGEAKKLITLNKAFPPPAVKNTTVTDVTSQSVTFEIEGPDNVIGPDVIGFTAEYDEAENYNITDIHINRTWSKDRPYKIDKLRPNTTYAVKIAAVNSVGAGPWTEIFNFDTLEKSMPEQIIWKAEATAGTDGVLKWYLPDDNGEPIDFIVVRYCPVNNDTVEEVECKEERINPTTEFQLNRMDANTTYYFEILAHNSLGNSSVSTTYVTIPAREEAQPLMSAGGLILIAVVVVLICLVIVDVILFVWRRQGIIASCCYKKNKKRIEDNLQSRDKKGLLKDNGESVASDSPKRRDRDEYKHTGIITGKHSAV